MKVWNKYSVLIVVMLYALSTNAQNKDDANNYTQVIKQRTAKILTAVGITDSARFKKAQAVLMDQYRFINDIHNAHNAEVKNLKEAAGDNKDAAKAKIAASDSILDKQLTKRHTVFLKKLGKQLSNEQIDRVKDEMTYKVMPLTYNAYLDELPQLTVPQKEQIKAWLIEAREHAIDAESSEKKHAWFGKYKGRINNFLSAQGYNMKKAGEEWQKRIKQRAAAK